MEIEKLLENWKYMHSNENTSPTNLPRIFLILEVFRERTVETNFNLE